MADVTLYQPKGKRHIRYINRMARNIWRDYGFKGDEWTNCIKRALKKHVTYLRSLDKSELPSEPLADPGRDGSWYKNASGIWIRL